VNTPTSITASDLPISPKERSSLADLVERSVDNLPVEKKRELGIEKLKAVMWNALGVDYMKNGSFDDTSTLQDINRRIKTMQLPNLKALEYEMEQRLRDYQGEMEGGDRPWPSWTGSRFHA